MSNLTPEHYIEMGVDPSIAGLSLEEIIERENKLEERIRRNRDCSGYEHDMPATSIVPTYSAGVIAVTIDVVRVNNSVNMLISGHESRRRGGFVR
jgi:hypothetical protein